ncbi:epoxide hydrolase, putative [Paecilomyces variotii No. 5]|uniref:Epoxide hydrolase, putative n=1 Tax=Byssochlamys spectabilis (strain No. 5 / NBRC 109023) TaxID=1356009 RepID=V5FXT8_BYSSN|nr:epoxide hydrolase, putative [Paecilomyces variotii No. 5]
MALQIFPDISKKTTVSDGTSYAYIRIPAANATKPTFLLLHGFPSSSYDWRRIVPKLKEDGYGIIAPDLLGYGDSDKPEEVEAYAIKRMADHVAEIVQIEGLSLSRVIGVGHDWGSGLLSATALAHREIFSGLVFLAVGYTPPGPFDIDQINAITEKALGYPANGYMKFFVEDTAASVIGANLASFTSLVYPTVPEVWKTDMGPLGAAKKWITSGKVTPPPPWLSQEELDTHTRILQKGGYTGPLNWYKAAARGINQEFVSKFTTDESKSLDIPSLLVTATYDCACPPQFQKPRTEQYLRKSRTEQLDCGHWIPLEKADETILLLEEFSNGI